MDRPQSTECAHERPQMATHCRDVALANDESLQEAKTPPQYCSKHGKWVETILKHCTDQTEQLSPAPASPLLFLSSSSSSDDLTPSNLVLQDAPSQSSRVSRAAAEGAAHTSDEEKSSCGWTVDDSQTQGLLQPFCPGDTASTKGACDQFAPPQASPDDSSNRAAIHVGARDSGTPTQTGQTPPASIVSQFLHEDSGKFGLGCPAKRPRKASQGDSFVAPSSCFTASFSGNGGGSGPLASTCTPSLVFFPQCSAHHISTSGDSSPSSTGSCRRPQTLQPAGGTNASLSSDPLRCESSPVQRPQLKMSLSCQAALLQSKLFQPYVSLTRLSSEQRSPQPGGGQEEDPCCSFDLNSLYSSYSSSSGGDDSLVYDPDYKPRITKKQLLLEYEAARTLI